MISRMSRLIALIDITALVQNYQTKWQTSVVECCCLFHHQLRTVQVKLTRCSMFHCVGTTCLNMTVLSHKHYEAYTIVPTSVLSEMYRDVFSDT